MLGNVNRSGRDLARVLSVASRVHVRAAERAAVANRGEVWRVNMVAAFERAAAAAAIVSCQCDFEPERTRLHLAAARIAMQCRFFDAAEALMTAARKGEWSKSHRRELAEALLEIKQQRTLPMFGSDAEQA